MVSTRSSERLVKKAKLDNDRVVETPVLQSPNYEQDNDDFQDPIPVLRRIVTSVRPIKTYSLRNKKQVKVELTSSATISKSLGESSSSAAAIAITESNKTVAEVEARVDQLIKNDEINEQDEQEDQFEEEIDQLTEEVDETPAIVVPLEEPTENLVVGDIESESEEEEPPVRARGRRGPSIAFVKYNRDVTFLYFLFTCLFCVT